MLVTVKPCDLTWSGLIPVTKDELPLHGGLRNLKSLHVVTRRLDDNEFEQVCKEPEPLIVLASTTASTRPTLVQEFQYG